jgi:murein DD-endopeptidase MepM/ murein hydrolase activator NlpD
MLSCVRKCHIIPGALFVSAAALAGCSADVSRFDLGFSDGARGSSQGSSYGTTSRSASSEFGSSGYDRPSYRTSEVSRSELPPTPQQGMTTAAIAPQQSGSYGGDSYRPSGQQSYGGSSNYGSSSAGYGSQPSTYGAQQQREPQYGGSQYAATTPPSYGGGSSGSGYSAAPAQPRGHVAPIASRGDAGAAGGGETISVRPGDTLYSLSRQHGVSVNEIKTANGMTSDSLQPGQSLRMPGSSKGRYASETARPPRENYETIAVRPVQQAAAAEAPSDWNRSYTVRPGDSMYAIAREHGVKLSELERNNGITDSRKVKPGTTLKVPGSDEAQTVADASAPGEAYSAPSPHTDTAPVVAENTARPEHHSAPERGVVRLGEQAPAEASSSVAHAPTTPAAPSTPQTPTMLNGTGLAGPGAPSQPQQPQRVAAIDTGTATDAVAPSAPQNSTSVAGFSKLRWPVSGRVVTGFGPRPDGTHNDGVNLAVPMGTDVHAAESGVVAYAGDELKGYGNLVLVRHDNGWVTAYAHADEILVKRGDQIKRGQVIAKAGRSGDVDQPQVHFELRQGQKPVDPTPFMDRL